MSDIIRTEEGHAVGWDISDEEAVAAGAEPDSHVGTDEEPGIASDYPGVPLYTLEEAAQILRDQVCAKDGHRISIGANAAGEPFELLCTICGRRGTVTWNVP